MHKELYERRDDLNQCENNAVTYFQCLTRASCWSVLVIFFKL